jgi:hypothetical protein
MKRLILLLSLAPIFFGGCVPVLVAGVGVVTGYVAFKDTTAGNVEASFDDVWDATVDVLKMRTVIDMQDKERGIAKGTLKGDQTSITVKIVPLAQNLYKLKVTARRGLAVPDLEAAQNIFTAIIRAMPQQEPDGSYR